MNAVQGSQLLTAVSYAGSALFTATAGGESSRSSPASSTRRCGRRRLNAGVPVAEVACRAGNSPEVIHGRYEGRIDGHEELDNPKIAKVMGWAEPP
ncbi:hypothetical protein [Streptomyces sp. NPDC054961]